ncbi:GntR family transcriptional regulator [Bifidobacterium aerophilum]|uniref:UTRA domain-containing protein n=1 Tax=Bifidobacterium aerophilum TaxID=1798155 RepID=A0A6N9Z690_9BIFI|nr:GntR family transcriptional regulator [Bifidobacterium aerophilum]NEG90021.1 UTRA domain-containing protein [Bifidobacterium aerophilum]
MEPNEIVERLQLSMDAALPLYEQMTSALRQQIRSGALAPGDKLPTENALVDALHVSRTTVRQAMDQLVDEGLVIRHRGRGSFVASPKMKRTIGGLYNFTENMRELGAEPSSVVLVNEVVDLDAEADASSGAAGNVPSPAPAVIRERLRLPASQRQVFHLKRLRCADGNPVLLEDTYIPYYLCAGVEQGDFAHDSLYQALSTRYALNLYHATETIAAIAIDKAEAQLLECAPKTPGYRITRVSNLDSGLIYEFTSSVTNAEKCEFQLELYSNTAKARKPMAFQRHVSL